MEKSRHDIGTRYSHFDGLIIRMLFGIPIFKIGISNDVWSNRQSLLFGQKPFYRRVKGSPHFIGKTHIFLDDNPFFVDEDKGRDGAESVSALQFLIGQGDRIVEFQRHDKFIKIVVIFIKAQAENLQSLFAVFFIEFNKVGNRPLARFTPAGKKVENQHMPLVIVQRNRLTGCGSNLDGGGRLPLLECSEHCRRHGQQKKGQKEPTYENAPFMESDIFQIRAPF